MTSPLQPYRHDRPADMGSWLRSLLFAGNAYVALYVVVHAVLALTTYGITPSDLVLLVLVAVPAAVTTARRGADIPRRRAAVLATTLTAAGALGLWTMLPSALDESYAAWFLGAITIDLLGLTVVGAFRTAWITMAALVALSVVWSASEGMASVDGLALVIRHVATLLIGTLLVLSLRRNRRTFAAFEALRRLRSTEEEAAKARAAARRIAVERVLDQAGPTLRAIAEGRRLTVEDRRQLLVLEGSLRDQIRTPMLVRGALRESAAAARRRGVNVLLMDEAEHADADARTAAAAWLAEQLDATADGGFVGRLRDLGDAVRVSAVNDDRNDAQSFTAGRGSPS